MSDPGVPPTPPPAAPAAPAAKPGRARRVLKIAAWTGGALVALVAAAPFLLSSGWANDAVRSWLDENVDREVTFRSLSLSWTSGIELQGVVVHDEVADVPPVLEAPRIALRVPLWKVALRDLDVEELAVDDPVVRVNERSRNVVKLRKARKPPKPGQGGPGEPGAASGAPAGGGEERTALPDLSVPLRVKNLTLVLRDAQGRETRRPGIEFSGNLNNARGARTTFDLAIPTAGAGSARVRGSARLFDEVGALLPAAEAEVDTEVELVHLDAQANADLLRLFLPERPVAGVLDAKMSTKYGGGAAQGSFDLRLRGVAVDAAVGARPASPGDDLTVAARFEWGGGKLRIEDLKVAAEGLSIAGGVRGTVEAMDGRIDVDADLARLSASLRAFGIGGGVSLAGDVKGGVVFTPEPSRGTGRFALTKLRVERAAAEGEPAPPPVTIDAVSAEFVAALGRDEQRLESCDVKLADVAAKIVGTRRKDGTLDARLEATGDLGRLLARVRDLGLLPSGLSVNGSLDAAIALRGDPAAKGDAGLVVTVERLVLSEDDVRIEAKGTAALGGAVDLTATGAGDLGKLLGRAKAAGAGGGGATDAALDAVRGRFAFEAQAKGPAGALVVRLPKFRIDGDLAVDASAEVRLAGDPGGAAGDGAGASSPAFDGKLHAEGRIDDALLLARRLGFLERDAALGGTIRADATFGGTAAAPVVPAFSLTVESPALRVGAGGSLAADKSVQASAKGEGDLARLAEFAVAAGFAPSGLLARNRADPRASRGSDGESSQPLPPVKGRLTFDASVAGTTAAPTVPRFTASLRDGPATADVSGSITETGRLDASLTADADLAALADLARAGGWLEKPLTPQGRATVELKLAGTRQRIYVPSARLDLDGPVTLRATGSMDAADVVKGRAEVKGTLQPLLDLAAQWTGGAARRLEGAITGSASVEGPRDAVVVTVPAISVTAGAMVLDLAGTRDARGDASATARLRGPVQDLVQFARAFDAAADVEAAGSIEASAEVKLAGRRATGGATAGIANLVVRRPEIGDGRPFREPRASLLVSGLSYDLDTGRLDPIRLLAQCEGAKLETTAEMRDEPGPAGGPPSRTISAQGLAAVEEPFVRNHPELFSAFRVARAEAPFRFAGDVSKGRAGAAGWTGGAEIKASGLVAPHLTMETVSAVAKLDGGSIVVDPIEGTANGGPVTGRAVIGLVGDAPAHTLELKGTDVALAADLAPLVARASPIFAVGEHGRTGGKANLDLRLAARGLDGATVKRTLTGGGTLGLADAFVESSDWIGLLLSIGGSSGRLDLKPVQVPFDVRDGRVRTGDVAMEGVGLLMRMGGDVSLEGKLDYALRVRPLRGGGVFEKYASLLDKEGFLPLRLEGDVSKPKLRAPEVKDVLKGKVEDLLGGLLGGRKKDEEKKDDRKDSGSGGRRSTAEAEGTDDPPPPPPPPRKRQ